MSECEGCIYRAAAVMRMTYDIECDYLSRTGRTRTAQLTREELRQKPCKLYEKGETMKIPRRDAVCNYHSKKFDPEKMHELYNAGMSDTAIAQNLGCSVQTVLNYRKKWGEPHGTKGTKTNFDWGKAQELYEQGYTDEEIAQRIGSKRATVQKRRTGWGAPNKRKERVNA